MRRINSDDLVGRLVLGGRQVFPVRTSQSPDLKDGTAVLLRVANNGDRVTRLQCALVPACALELVWRGEPSRPLGRAAVRILHVEPDDHVRIDEIKLDHCGLQSLSLRLVEGRAAMMDDRRPRDDRENGNKHERQFSSHFKRLLGTYEFSSSLASRG